MKMNWGKLVLGSALAMALTLPIGKATFGDRDWSNDCHKRLEADRARIDHDVARHGERSHAVDNDRNRLEADRSWCRNHHADWDHSRFDFGIYIRH
jgi:hypothetical protein